VVSIYNAASPHDANSQARALSVCLLVASELGHSSDKNRTVHRTGTAGCTRTTPFFCRGVRQCKVINEVTDVFVSRRQSTPASAVWAASVVRPLLSTARQRISDAFSLNVSTWKRKRTFPSYQAQK